VPGVYGGHPKIEILVIRKRERLAPRPHVRVGLDRSAALRERYQRQ